MNDKLIRNEMYTIVNTSKRNTKSYNYNDEANESLRGGEKACRKKKILKIYRRKKL
jgi:hypothetical protein